MIDDTFKPYRTVNCDVCGCESRFLHNKKEILKELETDFWHKGVRDEKDIDICKCCYNNIKNIKLKED